MSSGIPKLIHRLEMGAPISVIHSTILASMERNGRQWNVALTRELNEKDGWGRTALDVASAIGNAKAVALLQSYGAKSGSEVS